MAYRLYPPRRPGSKYNSKKVKINGHVFDSQKEATRYLVLCDMEKHGEIYDLELQKRFEIVPKWGKNRAAFYVADFVYQKDGKTIVEDCKGYRTDVYKLKKKMFEYRYNIEILET